MEAVALLLAAGDSQRMGESKALLPWRGQPLLSHQLQQIQKSRISECVVILGREADRLEPLVNPPLHPTWKSRSVRNPRPEQGKTSSIRVGLTSLLSRPDGILIASVDQPLDHRLLDCLLRTAEAEWEHHVSSARTIVVPTFEGRRGHPPIFSGMLMGELMGIAEESAGLKAVVWRYADRVFELPWFSAEILLNLNTPLDLAQPTLRNGPPHL